MTTQRITVTPKPLNSRYHEAVFTGPDLTGRVAIEVQNARPGEYVATVIVSPHQYNVGDVNVVRPIRDGDEDIDNPLTLNGRVYTARLVLERPDATTGWAYVGAGGRLTTLDEQAVSTADLDIVVQAIPAAVTALTTPRLIAHLDLEEAENSKVRATRALAAAQDAVARADERIAAARDALASLS